MTGENKKALCRSTEAITKGIYMVTTKWEQRLRQLKWDDRSSHEKAFKTGYGPTHAGDKNILKCLIF